MKFTKMHGLGNDYVYVNCFEEYIKDPKALSEKISDRHFGVGSDGLILICPSENADCRMRMFNADGSEGEMCGNGIRCVGKYAYEHGISKNNPMRVETLAGIKTLKLIVENDSVKSVTVNMGEPVLEAEKIPFIPERKVLSSEGRAFSQRDVVIENVKYSITGVSMGNPHGVIFINSSVMDFPVVEEGSMLEKCSYFPNASNIEFIQVINDHEINMRVWERGSGETLACGTGACASAVAAVLNGYTGRKVKVHLLGGDLLVDWNSDDNCVYMTGPAETAFEGIYNY